MAPFYQNMYGHTLTCQHLHEHAVLENWKTDCPNHTCDDQLGHRVQDSKIICWRNMSHPGISVDNSYLDMEDAITCTVERDRKTIHTQVHEYGQPNFGPNIK